MKPLLKCNGTISTRFPERLEADGAHERPHVGVDHEVLLEVALLAADEVVTHWATHIVFPMVLHVLWKPHFNSQMRYDFRQHQVE